MHYNAWPKRLASVIIDSATYLLMISSPDIDNIAMSLYDIKHSKHVQGTNAMQSIMYAVRVKTTAVNGNKWRKVNL